MTSEQIKKEVEYQVMHSNGCITKQLRYVIDTFFKRFDATSYSVSDIVWPLLTLEHQKRKTTFNWNY